MTGFAKLGLGVAEGVATITLRRPEARNALDMALKGELSDALDAVAGRPEIRALVVTGEGRAFCAGGDIEEMTLNDSPVTSRNRLRRLNADIFVKLAELEKPTIASLNGGAHGAGLSLALACDVIVASDTAEVSCAFSRVGLVPDCGALYFLPRRVSMGLAKELIFTGRRVGAAEARAIGLVNAVVPGSQLQATTAEWARRLADGPTTALALAKTLLGRSHQMGLRDLAELEAFGQALAYSTADHVAAREAFKTASQPVFHGQ